MSQCTTYGTIVLSYFLLITERFIADFIPSNHFKACLLVIPKLAYRYALYLQNRLTVLQNADVCLLGCNATYTYTYIPTLGRNVLHLLPRRRRQYVPPKHWDLPTSPHGVTTQKTNINIFTTVRPSNFIRV
jgi:hypothetical protein